MIFLTLALAERLPSTRLASYIFSPGPAWSLDEWWWIHSTNIRVIAAARQGSRGDCSEQTALPSWSLPSRGGVQECLC